MDAQQVVEGFVEAINRADVDRLSALMTESHRFVDSDGSPISGRVAAVAAWSAFFSMVRAYHVRPEEVFGTGSTVVIVGTATGVPVDADGPCPEHRWSVPAAWRAVVEGDRVAVWQLFVNPEPIVAAMRACSGSHGEAGKPSRGA